MKLILTYELGRRSERELSAMFAKVSKDLARTQRNTPERRNALGTLENIARARITRLRR